MTTTDTLERYIKAHEQQARALTAIASHLEYMTGTLDNIKKELANK